MSSDATSSAVGSTEPVGAPALPPAPARAPVTLHPMPGRSPGLALFLSFVFPGAGQLYNGQPAKAFAFFFGLVSAIYLTAEVDPMPFAFAIPFIVIYNLIDAWKSATALSLRAGGTEAFEEDAGFESPWWGGSLVALGIVLLANNLGWLRLAALQRYWPVLLILAGIWFLAQSLRLGQDDSQGGSGDDAGDGASS